MHSTCVSSSFSVRYRGASSFSLNDYNYCFNDTFDRNPLLNSSSQSCSTCCCCSNSFQSRVPILNPNYYLYGIRQSTLIQWSPSKRLILNGLEPSYGSRFSVCDVNRNYDAKERKAFDRKGKLGKGRFGCVGFEEESERRSLCGGFDEAEVILSLLTEDVSEECFSMREKRGKSVRKIDVKGRNGGGNNGTNRKKNVVSGVLKGMEKFEYEVKITKSREEGKSKEDNRRENEREIGSRRNNRGRANKEERDDQKERMREEEREILLRENQRERMREEERERLSRQADHRRKLRKDGSSCSSYYSLASGEFESDDEIQVEQEGFESSSGCRKDSKSREMVSKEVRKDFERHGHSKEYQMSKERNQAGFSGASNVVESDWRKKSEKKLTDGSVEKAQYEKESAQNLSTYIEDKKNSYQKDFESYSGFDDRNKMSTLSVNVDERTRDQNRQTSDTGNRMKYKQFTESSDAYNADLETSSTSHKFYGRMDENSSKSTSSVQEAKEQIRKEDKYRGSSSNSAEASKVQELVIRGTSTTDRRSETRMKDQEDHSTRIQSSVHDTEEELRQTAQASRIEDSRIKRQQLITDVNKESTSISHRESECRMRKHEAKSSFVYNSHLETSERLQETNSENVSRLEYRKGSQEVTVVDDRDKRKLEMIMASSHSQSAASGSLLDESRSGLKIQEIVDERLHSGSSGTSGLRIEEIGDERLQSGSTALHESATDESQKLRETKGDEPHGQPSKLLSPEDALGSADRFQKSSAHYVGEFVEKAKNEISSSEIDKVKDTYKAKLLSKDEKENQSILGSNVSGVSGSMEQDSRRSSQVSGTKGPSDQMWDVTEPAIEEPPAAEATVAESTVDNAVVKSSGKSFWNVIADVVRFRWVSRSENRSSPSKSGGKSSPNQSTGSETWFSGHEQEESNDSNVQKNKISLQAPLSIEKQQKENISSSLVDGSRSSSSKDVMKHSGAGASTSLVVIRKDSSPKTTLLPSNEAKATTAVTEGTELAPLLPFLQVGVLAAGKTEGSGSDTIVQVDQPVETLMRNKTSLESKNEELKRKKLQRIDQVQTDRFDEWEEAYMFETEQRKMDEMFMREALMEAKKAADCWEVPVGAVLVHDGKIIARGYNLVEELRDSTAHAEMICIREASNMLRTWRLSQTTLYVTLEPCPMCAGAILQARIDTVVWGAPNKLLGADGSWIRLFPNGDGESGSGPSDKPAAPVHPFHPNIAIRRGILSSECADIMQQFFQLRRKKETKKQEPTAPPPSCLPISHHPSKFMTKMHDAFHLMFCL